MDGYWEFDDCLSDVIAVRERLMAGDLRAPTGFAGLAIGLCLVLIHLFSIPVTNCSVNPVRSLGPALVAMTNGVAWPMKDLWLFFAAPAAGSALAGVVYRAVFHTANPDDVK